METKCKNNLEHKLQYYTTLEGRSCYICWFCPYVEFVLEEHHGG